MARETNQVACFLPKKHAGWLGSLPIGFFKKKKKKKKKAAHPLKWVSSTKVLVCRCCISMHRHQNCTELKIFGGRGLSRCFYALHHE